MQSTEEIWKDVPGYEGFYKVSNSGLVKSIPRNHGRWATRTNERFIKPNPKKGYPTVVLCKENKARTFLVHRLVALAFIPNPESLPVVNHLDGKRDNNLVSNLEWTTHLGNSQHAVRSGLIPIGEKVHNAILSDETVNHIRTNLKHMKCTDIAKMYNMNYFTMWDIIKQRRRK